MTVWETLDYDNSLLNRGRPGATSGADLIAAMGARPPWLAADLTICLARLFAFAAAQRGLRPPQVGLVVTQMLKRKSLWSGKTTTERHPIQVLGSMALWQIVTPVHDGPDGGIFIRRDGHCFAVGVSLGDASQRPVGQIGVDSELDIDPSLWSGNGYYEPRIVFDWSFILILGLEYFIFNFGRLINLFKISFLLSLFNIFKHSSFPYLFNLSSKFIVSCIIDFICSSVCKKSYKI